jgi:hypothetical protein
MIFRRRNPLPVAPSLGYFAVQNVALLPADPASDEFGLEVKCANFTQSRPDSERVPLPTYANLGTRHLPMLIRLSAITPRPTHRRIPSRPW